MESGVQYIAEKSDSFQANVEIVENDFGAFDKVEEDGSIHDPY